MNDGKTTDEIIKHCKSCNKCWEKLYMQFSSNHKAQDAYYIHFYEDFPSYGKEKKTCYTCNNKTKPPQIKRGLVVHEIIKS
tara:strand:- start:3798 stop:4040 length:243 start_codon:yes stop_codon:yes gene_type:complete